MIRPPRRRHTGRADVVATAVRQATRFDRTMVSPSAGLLAALPVTATLGGGIGAGDPVAGVTMGAGAMLVGIAWRVRGGRPRRGLLAADAVLMALATFLGCITGGTEWLHLILLAALSLAGGLLVALGPGGGVLGNQAVLAAVVFGRFSEPAPTALGLAGLVFAGGAAQVIFLTIVRWPTPLRTQREATAAAYRALAASARGDGTGTLAAARALDEAEASLAAPALLGDAALIPLRSLVGEGMRIRLGLAAVQSLIRQGGGESALAASALAVLGDGLEQAARAIEGDAGARAALARLAEPPARPIARAPAPPPEGIVARQLERRLAALAGQMRAVAALAQAAGEGGGLRDRRPHPRGNLPLLRLRANASTLRANASLSSPAGRHALRLAAVVVVAELIASHIPLARSYWMVVAAATTLRPEFGATFTRGTERALGTAVGVALAGAIVVSLHPAGGVIVALVAGLAWAAYSVFPASFAAGFAFITALVVFLLNAIAPDTLATAEARLLNTLLGAALGLIAYAAWPTWASRPARIALANLAAAQRDYLDAVLDTLIAGRRAEESRLRPLARRARLAWTQAESTVATSLSEPHTRRIDADQARGALATMRRLVQAAHVLRLDAQDEQIPPLSGLEALRRDVDGVLLAVEADLRGAPHPPPPSPLDVRERFEGWAQEAAEDPRVRALVPGLDEIVDAVNSLAAVTGVEAAVQPAAP